MIPLGILGSGYRAPTGNAYTQAVLADSPAIYWRLDETSGTSAADASGNSRTGTYSGNYTLNQSAAGSALGSSVTFAAGKVEVAYGSWLNVDTFTIEAWVYQTDASQIGTVAAMRGGSGDRWQFRREGGSGQWSLVLWDAAGTASVPDLGLNPTLSTWNHLVVVKDGTSLRSYQNGTLKTTQTSTGTLFAASNQPFSAAGHGSPLLEGMVGGVDEVAFYPTALSAASIQSHYNARNG